MLRQAWFNSSMTCTRLPGEIVLGGAGSIEETSISVDLRVTRGRALSAVVVRGMGGLRSW
jgi:hypothetical protein